MKVIELVEEAKFDGPTLVHNNEIGLERRDKPICVGLFNWVRYYI